MHCPSITHWSTVKRVLRYLKGTIHLGLFLRKHSPLTLHAFVDVDSAGNSDDHISTSAYVVFLGCNPISWSSKKQKTVFDPPLKQNIELLLPSQLNSIGCKTYFMDFMPNVPLLQQFTATMWAPHMCVPILYFILA